MQTLACKILAGWAGPPNLNVGDARESEVEAGLGSTFTEHQLPMGLCRAGGLWTGPSITISSIWRIPMFLALLIYLALLCLFPDGKQRWCMCDVIMLLAGIWNGWMRWHSSCWQGLARVPWPLAADSYLSHSLPSCGINLALAALPAGQQGTCCATTRSPTPAASLYDQREVAFKQLSSFIPMVGKLWDVCFTQSPGVLSAGLCSCCLQW